MSRTLEGKVFDKETNQPLAFAVVAVTDESGNPIQPVISASTNSDGTFKIDVPSGTHLSAKYTGYPKVTLPILSNTNFDFAMQAGYNLPEVEVFATKDNSGVAPKKVNYILWSGIGLSFIGVSLLVIAAVKKMKNG